MARHLAAYAAGGSSADGCQVVLGYEEASGSCSGGNPSKKQTRRLAALVEHVDFVGALR